MTTPEFTITRTFNAPRELVWKAWTDKFELARWFHPMGVTAESVSVDLRVGGRYRYTMLNESTGEEYPTGGEYLAINPVEKLVFSWGHPDAPVEGTPVITLDLAERGDTTGMTFHLSGIAGVPGDGHVYDGWDEALTNLENALATA